jgi:hypothetical protein
VSEPAPTLKLPAASVYGRVSGRPPRPWIIGEQNPYGADPRFALYPLPPQASGGRLCRMLELTEEEYLAAFERRNLLTSAQWSAPAARAAANALLQGHPDADRLVLLGARVAAAFGLAFREGLYEVRELPSPGAEGPVRRALVLPHPSGLSREWNDRAAPSRVRAAVADLLAAGEAHP